MRTACGGCQGQGRHWRWCPWVVGAAASQIGQRSVEAETLGDRIGPNNMRAANMAYALAGELRRDADERAAAYMERYGTSHTMGPEDVRRLRALALGEREMTGATDGKCDSPEG